MERPLVAFLFYAGITIALTFPLITRLGTALPSDAGDPALNTWILWWNAHAVPYSDRWWNAPAFYPSAGVLAFSEHLLGLSLISTPLQWLGAGPQLAYNTVLLLTFPLCALGAYLLAFELTERADAAFVAGLLFGFAPYRIAHLPQIQCLAAFPMPFALLGLHRYLRDRRPRWLVLFGAGWLLQALCNGYYMLFFGVVVALWVIWFARSRRLFLEIVGAWVVASLPLAPLLWRYRAIHEGFGFARDFGTIRNFGADLAGLFDAAASLRFWGWLRVYSRAEGEIFPGLTIALLVAAGVLLGKREPPQASDHREQSSDASWLRMARGAAAGAALVALAIALSAAIYGPWNLDVLGLHLFSVANPVKPFTGAVTFGTLFALASPGLQRSFASRSVLGFYGVAGVLTWIFSLGPAPTLMGRPFMYRGPYALLMLLPGISALRVPARFWMMTTLCLAVVGAILFDRLASRMGRARLGAALVVSLAVLADGWVTNFPMVKPPETWAVEACEAAVNPTVPGSKTDSPLVELPLGDPYRDVAAMYRGMSHGRPLVNGYSGYFPPQYGPLRLGLSLRDDDVLTQLASLGATDIVVDSERDDEGAWKAFVAAHPGTQTICSEEGRTLYRLPTPAPSLLAASGTVGGGAGSPVLPIAVLRANVNDEETRLMVDGDLDTRWQSGPQSDRTVIDIDLGTERSVDAVQLLLGPFVWDFPRFLSIEALGDGATWRELYRGGSAGRAFVGALESPRDVPMTFDFPAVTTRYLRLRTLANDETYYWSIAELKVVGK